MTGSCRFPLLFSFLPISPARRWNARMEYLKYNASKKRERYSRCPLFLSLAVRNSGLCVCQILRFCRLLSSDFFSSCVIPEKKENACIRVSIPIFPESRKSPGYIFAGFRRKYVTRVQLRWRVYNTIHDY